MSFTPAAEAVIYGGGTAALSLPLWLTYRWWKFPFWAFFSRLQKPRILEQETRVQVYQFIQARPGVRAQEILRGLDLATGQTMHHLGVLRRHGLITRTQSPFARRFFVSGVMPPSEMQKLIAREHPVIARAEMLVRRAPGILVRDVARGLGTSKARASRIVQQLVEVRLVERRQEGRSVRLFPMEPTVAAFGTNPPARQRRTAVLSHTL